MFFLVLFSPRVSNKSQQRLIVISSVAHLVQTDSMYSDCYVNDSVKEGGGGEEEGGVNVRRGKGGKLEKGRTRERERGVNKRKEG